MKLDDPALIDLLARRFVTGLQRGSARRRFESLLRDRADVRRAVDFWEARLTPLAWGLAPVEPSELLWQRICRELEINPSQSKSTRTTSGVRWAAVAAGFAALAIIAAGGWWRAAHRPPEIVTETRIEQVPEAVSVAVVTDTSGQPLWLARIAPASREMTVRMVTEVAPRPNNDYELWALTDAGVPVSLGLLPQSGRQTVSLDDEAIAALTRSSSVAVSLEPPGGSPQATPTGPVLYTGALLEP